MDGTPRRLSSKRAGVKGQVTGEGSLFRIYLNDQPTGILREAKVDPRETQQLAELRTRLIDRGYFLAGGLLGCLSTQTTHDHVDGLCEALTELLPAVGEEVVHAVLLTR